MKHYLTYQDDVSDKFWQIETFENNFTVTYGRTGTSGQNQTKTFDSVEKCLKEAEKILAEKRKKGYSEDGFKTVVTQKVKSEKVDDLQEVLAAFDKIIENRFLDKVLPFLITNNKVDKLLPFLQSVEKRHYEPLRKHIRKAKKYWMNYVEFSLEERKSINNWGGWGYRGDEIQKKIITLSAIALFDKTEITPWDESFEFFNQIDDETVREILLWAKPSWVDSFLLDKMLKNEWQAIDYRNLRKLEDLDLINYNPQLYAKTITTFRAWGGTSNLNASDFIDFIYNDQKAIERDVPSIFDYETNIQNCFGNDETYKWRGITLWEEIFNRLLKADKINRQWFLESCLQTQTKEWNNGLRSFFRKRFEDTQPTKAELLILQQSFFPLLHASVNQVPNFAIGLIKDIYEEESFEMDNFLDWIQPVLMREDCKGSLKILLTMFEKICKNQPQYQAKILDLVVDVFVVNDLSLQEKASKIIIKYAQKNNEEFTEKLTMYAPQMLGNVMTLVSGFLIKDTDNEPVESNQEYNFSIKKRLRLNDKNLVQLPNDWNELLFFIGNFITSNSVIDEEVLINSLLLLKSHIPKDYQVQCLPYLKKLQNTYYDSWYKNFTKEFLIYWIQKGETTFKKNGYYGDITRTLELQFNRLQHLDNKIKNKSNLPLLSFPTHEPYWIEPKTLIERLIAYQDAGEEIDMLDLAIAIARMPRERVEEALPLCENLESNLSKLMKFCLGEKDSIEIELDKGSNFLTRLFSGNSQNSNPYSSLWALAARTYYPEKIFSEFEKTFLADVPNVVAPFNSEPYFKEGWHEWQNYETKEMQRTKSWFYLNVDFPSHKDIPQTLLYSLDIFGKKHGYYSFSSDDVYYWYGLTPQNLNALYTLILKSSCGLADESGRVWEGTLKAMLRSNTVFNQTSLLVLATACFQQKREARGYAAEVLIHHFQEQTIEPQKLGEQLGFMLVNKFAPLQRLLDVIALVKDISPLHNQGLLMLVDDLILKLKSIEEFPTNTKKLLEIYFDLFSKTKKKPSAEIQEVLTLWQNNASLKNICKQISEI